MINGMFVQLTGTLIAIAFVIFDGRSKKRLLFFFCERCRSRLNFTCAHFSHKLTTHLAVFHLNDFHKMNDENREEKNNKRTYSAFHFKIILFEALLQSREFNSFKIMLSCFNSVLYTLKAFANSTDIMRSYQMQASLMVAILFISLVSKYLFVHNTYYALQPMQKQKLVVFFLVAVMCENENVFRLFVLLIFK